MILRLGLGERNPFGMVLTLLLAFVLIMLEDRLRGEVAVGEDGEAEDMVEDTFKPLHKCGT